MIKQFISQNHPIGGVKITFDAGVLEGIDLDHEVSVFLTNTYGSITDTYEFNSSQLTDFSFIDKKGAIGDPSGWGIQVSIPNTRASRDAYKYGIQMSINGIVIDPVATAQSEGEQVVFSIIYMQQNIETINLRIVYLDNYVYDEDVVVDLANGAHTQIFCPSFIPNMQYKFIFEIGEVTDTVKNDVTPGAGKYVTDALTISNGSNKLFVSRLQGVIKGTLYLQYDSDDNIFLYPSSGRLLYYTSLTLTGVIAVPMPALSPGYVTLDFNDGFIDRYDPYYTGVKNWQEVADFIWADSIDSNQVNLQITTTNALCVIHPEKVSSDGRYLYFNVAETLGTNVYIETVLYQDTIIGEEFEYQNPNNTILTTYIGNCIANRGMRGAIENGALVLKES